MLTERGLWNQFKEASPAGQEAIQKTIAYRTATTIASQRKEMMRWKDRALDRVLYDWGYTGALITGVKP